MNGPPRPSGSGVGPGPSSPATASPSSGCSRDNGSCYRAKDFTAELVEAGIKHKFTRPYRPQTNGKIERFNRTLQNEWAYARPYRSEAARTRALDTWLHMYNHHRHHTAIGGPPTSRVNNLVGQNT